MTGLCTSYQGPILRKRSWGFRAFSGTVWYKDEKEESKEEKNPRSRPPTSEQILRTLSRRPNPNTMNISLLKPCSLNVRPSKIFN